MTQALKYDENLYSRMLGAYGADTVDKLVQLKVFLSGLRGVGIETAKNLILSGPAEVQIHDDGIVEGPNMGCNFFIKEADIGNKTRADASIPQLIELNPNCKVDVHRGAITAEVLAKFDVVVITDNFNQKEVVEISNICRDIKKGFIYAGQLGLYGFTFVDFGESHTVFDLNGEEPRNCIVVGVTQEKEKDALVTVMDDKRHGFSSGDIVVFREIQGMTELNDQEFEIEVKSQYSFTLKGLDTTNWNANTGQGIVEQVKKSTTIQFRKLLESILNPFPPGKKELDHNEGSKLCTPEQLHLTLTGLLQFVAKYDQLPELNSEKDADLLVYIVKQINNERQNFEDGVLKINNVNEEAVKNVARFARTQISPFASFWGGIVAQEIIKLTGKYQPLHQWLHHECFEALPKQPVKRTVSNTRYHDQIAIFGDEFQLKLMSQKIFLVGAGALGCEFIKLFALAGLGTVEYRGQIAVTDDDQIEMSNLNTHFLFRNSNIGMSKSECACNAGSKMNDAIRFTYFQESVTPENEHIFNDQFWESRDFIVSAVDNVKARLFIDGRCVWFKKPLFESGTLGTKCSSQVIIPSKTQSYSESIDPPEESFPLCIIKNFPYQIEHTIQWARDYFEGVLVEGPNETKKFIQDPNGYIASINNELKTKPAILRGRLEIIQKYSKAYSTQTYKSCIELARQMHEDLFCNHINQLLHSFPENHKTESGQPFWQGPKRLPVPIHFEQSDSTSIEFIQSTANIFAKIFGLEQQQDTQLIIEEALQVILQTFKPNPITINRDKLEITPLEDDETVIYRLSEELRAIRVPDDLPKINPIKYEKDDPTNQHVQFVSALANLRARNYKIKEAPKYKVKLIAGKILPALVTTTAMIVGSVGIEIFKYILQKPVTQMKNAFMNLALPLWIFSEPQPPIQAKDKEYDPILMGAVRAIPSGHTTWDKIEVKGPKTIGELIFYFWNTHQVNISIISVGKLCIYNQYMPDAFSRENLDIAEAVVQLGKTPIPEYKKFLEIEVCGENQAGENVLLPIIKYALKQ